MSRNAGSPPPALRLYHDREVALLDVWVHHLRAAAHGLGEDVDLILLREVQWEPSDTGPSPLLAALPARQREVAHLLVTTSLSYNELAARMGVRVGTIRKHVETVYRALGVHSRAELVVKLRA